MANNNVPRKEDPIIPDAPATSKPAARNFRDIVEGYLSNRLPHDLHPSFKRVGHVVSTEPRPALHASFPTEPKLKTTIVKNFADEGSGDQDEEELPDELYKEAESEKNRFFCAVASYERAADEKYRTQVTFQGSVHTWDEVLAEVDHIACQYKDIAGFWAKIRKGLRKFGDNDSAFDAWTELLPTQSLYCSVLCGGLKLVIRAAARLKDIRESICDALSEIPVLLNNTKLILGAFKKSKELHRCSSTLYVTTLAALEHIVTWYQVKATKKAIKSFFKQEAYERQLTEKVEAIKTASTRFADAAKICSYQKQDIIYHEIQQNRNEVKENRLRIERSRSEATQNYEILGHVLKSEAKETRQDMEWKLAEMLESNYATVRGQIESSNDELRKRMDVLLEYFLSSNDRIDPETHDLRKPLLPTSIVPNRIVKLKKNRTRKQQEALHVLAYEESVPNSDIKSVLRIAWILPKVAQDRAVSLMQSPKLHTWIKASESTILFVNGNDSASTRQSCLSFVCAKLMDSIQSTTNTESQASSGIFTHGFFCGQHLHSKDQYGGIDGMMRSLLGQLLIAHSNFDLYTIERLQHIDQSNVDILCEMYFCLIMQLPAQETVFCIIDGMVFHEGSRSRCREALTVIQTLVRLTKSCDGDAHCILKVLLTCSGTSRTLYEKIDKKDVLWMPRKVSAQGGFTSMKWSASMGKDLDDCLLNGTS